MSANAQRDAVFLEEMGIGPMWTLRNAPAPAAAQAETALPEAAVPAAVQAAASVSAGAALPQEVVADDIASMGWDALRAAVASCTRCGLCKGGAKPVFGSGAQQAQWLVAAGATNARDEKEASAVTGEAGVLLGNMLAAVGLSRDSNAYVTNLIKCRPTAANGGDRAPTADEAAACRPYLERELALTGATQVLTLGQIAANGLQGKPLSEPLSSSRGTVHAINGVPLVATLHPGELLLRGGDKALAWADLCLAKAGHAAD
jgi:uracil-DNA glycosylase family 4